MDFKTIILEISNDIATVYLNRPDVYNAVNETLLRELHHIFDEFRENDSIRAVILSGKGPAFAGGADLQLAFTLDAKGAANGARYGQELMDKIEALQVPVIAAINGFAMGGGAELAWACDLRIASERAIFAQPEVKFGFNLGWGGSQRLPYLVGRTRAMEMMLLAKNIDAKMALEWGLVNKVVEHEKLMDEALAMAERIKKYSQTAIHYTKKSTVDGYRTGGNSMILESELWGACFHTDEPKKRIQAFIDKLFVSKK